MPGATVKEPEYNKMVDNAMRVLDLVRTSQLSCGVNEIAKHCKLNPSTTFRILKTLEMSGWVYQLQDDRYVTGEKLSFVTAGNNFYMALHDISDIIMNAYAKKYNHPMNLMVRDGNACFILQQARTTNIIDYITPKYSRLPFYTSASGKILLSELPLNLLDLIFRSTEMKPLTQNTIRDPETYLHALRNAAKNGYAFDNHESSPIGSAIAVPIRNHLGTIICSLSFCGIIGIDNPEKMLDLLAPLNEAAERISKSLYLCNREKMDTGVLF